MRREHTLHRVLAHDEAAEMAMHESLQLALALDHGLAQNLDRILQLSERRVSMHDGQQQVRIELERVHRESSITQYRFSDLECAVDPISSAIQSAIEAAETAIESNRISHEHTVVYAVDHLEELHSLTHSPYEQRRPRQQRHRCLARAAWRRAPRRRRRTGDRDPTATRST